jgi:hypothetical protein
MRPLLCALLAISLANGQTLTTDQIAAAIAYGSHYKTRDQFLEKGLRGIRVKVASAMALDGISKFATFFNDWNYIAAEAAGANQQLREVKPEDFDAEGLLHAFVEIHARGAIPASKLNRRYLQDRAHLVIRVGDKTIQPVAKSMLKRSDQSPGSVVLGLPTGKITLEFAFGVAPNEMAQEVEVILVDGDGNQHKGKANLAEALQSK